MGNRRHPAGVDDRQSLDRLIQRLDEPGFKSNHSRETGLRETSAHVNPLMLAGADSSSPYIAAWRDHAARCPACRSVFEYFGL